MDRGLVLFGSDGRPLVKNRRLVELANRMLPALQAEIDFRTFLAAVGLPWPRLDCGAEAVELQPLYEGTPTHHESILGDGSIFVSDLKPVPNVGILVTIKDITLERRAQAEIDFLAFKDPLTGLANRSAFQSELSKTVQRAAGSSKTAVLCLDLDRFKSVNDSLGHAIGDALLKQAAQRIRRNVRSTDIVARLGGDEFAVVQPDAEFAVDAAIVAARLVAALGEPFEIDGNTIQIGTSVGIALAPDDSLDGDELMKMAEIALGKAKAEGRNSHRFFEVGMDNLVRNRRALELDLRVAAAAQAFELVYQPLFAFATNAIVGFEALIRWNHPERGPVSPLEFIPLAEETGLIRQIGAWVLKQACQDAMSWPGHLSVAVNLSAVQFNTSYLPADVMSALDAAGLRPERLELEITESVVLQDTSAALKLLHQLKALGTRIAMDDFGTGYSSLAYLQKFPFDKIKIDRAFIDGIDTKPASLAIVRAVTSIGASLGMQTTAEGVETLRELQCLRSEGCTQAQGYLISKPMPASAVPAFLASHKDHKLAA